MLAPPPRRQEHRPFPIAPLTSTVIGSPCKCSRKDFGRAVITKMVAHQCLRTPAFLMAASTARAAFSVTATGFSRAGGCLSHAAISSAPSCAWGGSADAFEKRVKSRSR